MKCGPLLEAQVATRAAQYLNQDTYLQASVYILTSPTSLPSHATPRRATPRESPALASGLCLLFALFDIQCEMLAFISHLYHVARE